MIELKPEKN